MSPRSAEESAAIAQEIEDLVALARVRDRPAENMPPPAPLDRDAILRAFAPVEVAAEVAPAEPPPPAAGCVAPPAPKPAPRVRRVRLTRSDQAFLHQLGRTGVASDRHANDCAGLRPHRVRRLRDEGYIEERRRWSWTYGNVRYYVLGPAGRRLLRRERFGTLYHTHPAQLLHDLKLTDVYYRLPESVRRTWVPEGQIREALQRAGRYVQGRCVDAAVMIRGRPYAIEALTPHYKASQIAQKHAAIAEFFGGRALIV
jgi:hypothetical protein